jgi:hypothetical protein
MEVKYFLKHIKQVINSDTKHCVKIDDIDIVYSVHKNSSQKEGIWRVKLNDQELTKHSPYRWRYYCITCGAENEVGMAQIHRKLNGNISNCSNCVNKEQGKIETQRDKIKGNRFALGEKLNVRETKIISNKERIIESEEAFEQECEAYQQAYYKTHLTFDDFEKIRPHLVAIRNGHIRGEQLDKLSFIPVFKVSNQMKYSYVLYDEEKDIIMKADQPILKCEGCDMEWRGKSIETHKNREKILCQNCKLCRDTFKIRHIKNILGEKLCYQSQFELKFIKWCEEHNIVVRNGPAIKYTFQNAIHEYRIDFYLPDSNLLVEIKDNHIWHKRQIESGKWKAKLTAVKSLLQKEIYREYLLIYPKNWMTLSKYILKCQCKI